MIRHGSLFSGIGGFDLAATWMGWENVFSCEKDPFCRKVLRYYWPHSNSNEDIFQFNATPYRGCIDILSGGFPCQPFSVSGKRKGETDDRYLWPQARRIITEVRPEWIVLENVAGLFSILEQQSLSEMEIKAVELFCEDPEQGQNRTVIRLQRRVIGRIISEIGSAGYLLPQLEDGTPVVLCLPACAVDAPHRRDRCWFVARSKRRTPHVGKGRRSRSTSNRKDGFGFREFNPGQFGKFIDLVGHAAALADAGSDGRKKGTNKKEKLFTGSPETPDWTNWPRQPPFCGGDDGLPGQLDGITFPAWRSDSVKAFGNAIVPQVALEIFRAIEKVGF